MKAALSRCFTVIDRTIEGLIAFAFAAMVAVGGFQVFSRYVLRHSLSWSEEFQKYMHIWLIFLAVPLAYKQGAHIGMRVLFDRLPDVTKKMLSALFDILWLALGGAMIYYTTRIMGVARFQTSPGLGIRMDAVYLCIVIGGAYLSLMALRNLAGHVKALYRPDSQPDNPVPDT